MIRVALLVALLLPALPLAVAAQSPAPTPEQTLLRGIYKELVEINTTDSVGDTTQAARAMAARLKAGGFADADLELVVPPGAPRKGNLVARLKGTGPRKPLLPLATSTSSRPRARTGTACRASGWRRTATCTRAAAWTTRRWPRSSWRT